MTTSRHRRQAGAAFSLVELLTAVAVLSVLLAFVGLLVGATSKATQLSRERMDADRQARLIFDCMAEDFTLMLRRPDVDFHFVKQAGNDTFFFFCEGPGYFDTTQTSATESNVSLVGYRIYTNTPVAAPHILNTLEKLAKGLTWDAQGSAFPVPYLTLDNPSTTFAPDSNSTILGIWSGIDQPTYADTNFHLLGDSTFRIEFCFLLIDGTYSLVPAHVPPGLKCNLSASVAPTPSDGYASGYRVGSRWYDTTHCQGYRCTYAPQAPTNAAVWQPLGMSDVQAVVVAIAILDQTSQKMIGSNASALSTLATALTDPTAVNMTSAPPQLMATTWLNAVNSSTFASSVGLPAIVASQVRIYQRYFYLNNLSNNL